MGFALSAQAAARSKRRTAKKDRAPVAAAVPFELPSEARQLLLVTTPSWNSARGALQRFERKEGGAPWQPLGERIPVWVGRKGLGWGVGFGQGLAGPRKAEGDGRAPAGIFPLGTAFGMAPAAEAAFLKLPYLVLSPDVECVDDARSRSYNRLLARGSVPTPDWKSSEKMLAVGEQYRWGAVVDYNAQPVSGRGSCIFLHVESRNPRGTAGCTAMKKEALLELLRWLDGAQRPVLLQLPESVFEPHAPAWALAVAPPRAK
jgi:D-alanyl-D-alanine dipeptidase